MCGGNIQIQSKVGSDLVVEGAVFIEAALRMVFIRKAFSSQAFSGKRTVEPFFFALGLRMTGSAVEC